LSRNSSHLLQLTNSTSPVETGDGNALEWAGTRRDVVFCSVVVTTSVITSLRDDELTERAMVTESRVRSVRPLD
jgi:hypothetical protein